MLLQSGHSLGAEHLATSNSSGQQPTTDYSLDAIQDCLKEGWTVHTAKEGRLYYCK